MSHNPVPDPVAALPADVLRGLTSPRLSRRDALRLGGVSGLALALAACGVSGGAQAGPTGSAAVDAAAAFWAKQTPTKLMNFANWPLYIDVSATNKSNHPSIDLFTKQTGIKVTYSEVIQANDSFFGQIQPQLAADQSIGYDLMVITNGIYLDKLRQLNYLQALDQSKMTNFNQNASPLVKSPSYDRGNQFTMAWQSGMTGIGYNPKLTGRPITSWQDLQDPAFKGKIGMFADNQDLPNSAICAIGVNPESSTQADWQNAANWLLKQRDAGLVRKYYAQDYIAPLSAGDLWISMAWSGDIFQANASGASLEFVIPKEGAPIWTDNMCIPKTAVNPVAAMTYMDFVYQPQIAAMLAESINYVTPVPAAVTYITADAANATGADKASLQALVTSPLIFPPASETALLHHYRVLTTAEEPVWNKLFEPIYQA
ncbi:MAG: extracellular solute-binding protein [Candidatus Nanopelagicales bacterium]